MAAQNAGSVQTRLPPTIVISAFVSEMLPAGTFVMFRQGVEHRLVRSGAGGLE
jgi:hypothetical protein